MRGGPEWSRRCSEGRLTWAGVLDGEGPGKAFGEGGLQGKRKILLYCLFRPATNHSRPVLAFGHKASGLVNVDQWGQRTLKLSGMSRARTTPSGLYSEPAEDGPRTRHGGRRAYPGGLTTLSSLTPALPSAPPLPAPAPGSASPEPGPVLTSDSQSRQWRELLARTAVKERTTNPRKGSATAPAAEMLFTFPPVSRPWSLSPRHRFLRPRDPTSTLPRPPSRTTNIRVSVQAQRQGHLTCKMPWLSWSPLPTHLRLGSYHATDPRALGTSLWPDRNTKARDRRTPPSLVPTEEEQTSDSEFTRKWFTLNRKERT